MSEMVPILSYLVQRGRCRHCQVTISPFYPLLELGAAMIAAMGGLVSWVAGLAALGTLVGAAWASGRTQARRTTGGFMLVEVVVAFMLLAISIGAVLDLFGVVRHAVPAGYRRTAAVAIARAQYSLLAQGLTQSASSKKAKNYCNGERGDKTGEDLLGIPELAIYQVEVDYDEARSDDNQCFGVTITVSCPDCPSRYGEALVPVTVRGYIRKKLKQSGV